MTQIHPLGDGHPYVNPSENIILRTGANKLGKPRLSEEETKMRNRISVSYSFLRKRIEILEKKHTLEEGERRELKQKRQQMKMKTLEPKQ